MARNNDLIGRLRSANKSVLDELQTLAAGSRGLVAGGPVKRAAKRSASARKAARNRRRAQAERSASARRGALRRRVATKR
jgi:hypothetical protein